MSGYFWNDSLFENTALYEGLKKEMESCLDILSEQYIYYAMYRFGLRGCNKHSAQETAEYFSISEQRVKTLDSGILRNLDIRTPTTFYSDKLRRFLEE